MPRLDRFPWKWTASFIVCAAVPPPALHAALAATAATLFEAAPFVLAASLVPAGRMRALVPLLGCGCRGSALPGALALPAVALCWISFGWLPTLGRIAFAVGWIALRARLGPRTGPGAVAPASHADPLGTLAELVPFALGAALCTSALPDLAPRFASLPLAPVWLLLAGALLGRVMPCTTAGVAVAAGLHAALPALALGLLATGGLVAPSAPPRPANAQMRHSAERAAYLLLGIVLAYVAVRAPPGFITPRLGTVVACGALLAAWRTRAPGGSARSGGLAPVLMAIALVLGSPQLPYTADATALEGAFAGEALHFTGIAHRTAAGTVLERYVIACCRIDATPIAIVLDTPLAVPTGTWIVATGILVRQPGGGLALRTQTSRAIAPPRDPFAYR